MLAVKSSGPFLIPLSLNLRHKKLGKYEMVGLFYVRKLRSKQTVTWKQFCAATPTSLAGRFGFKSRLWASYLVLINHVVLFFLICETEMVMLIVSCEDSMRYHR